MPVPKKTKITREEVLSLKRSGKSYKEIARIAGVSQQRIQQISRPPKRDIASLLRDAGYACQKCGMKEKELHIHHITYDDVNPKLSVLCSSCHAHEHNGHKEARARKKILYGEHGITERELAVLQGMLASRINKQIATDLKISVKTVEKHRTSLYRKLDAHSTAAALVAGLRCGLITIHGLNNGN